MNRILLMVLRNFWKVPGLYLKLCHYAKHTEKYSELEKYQHIQKILRLGVKTGNIDLQAYGQENIPKEGAFLLYSNHQGLFDVLAVVTTCDRPLAAILKKELADIPFLKQIIACTGSYPMDREDIKQSMQVITSAIKEVKEGRSFLIYPEGTRSKNGNEMLPFHSGSFKCATRTKVPIVPIAVIDSFRVLDQKGCAPVSVQIHYLKPITCEEYEGMKTVELANLVQERIAEAIAANVSETEHAAAETKMLDICEEQ